MYVGRLSNGTLSQGQEMQSGSAHLIRTHFLCACVGSAGREADRTDRRAPTCKVSEWHGGALSAEVKVGRAGRKLERGSPSLSDGAFAFSSIKTQRITDDESGDRRGSAWLARPPARPLTRLTALNELGGRARECASVRPCTSPCG